MNKTEHIEKLVDRFVKDESETVPDGFNATRIMTAAGNGNNHHFVQVTRLWQMVITVFVLTLAVFAGVMSGNLYKRDAVGNNIVLINDDVMEHFEFYTAVTDE